MGTEPRRVSGVEVTTLTRALHDVLGDEARVSAGDSDRDLHSEDITFHPAHRPDVVVYPTTTEEVSRVSRSLRRSASR